MVIWFESQTSCLRRYFSFLQEQIKDININRVGEGWAYYLFHCILFPCNTFTSKINEQGEALCKCFFCLFGDLKYRWGKRQKRSGIDYLYKLVHAHMYIIIYLLWWCDAFHDVTCTGGDMIVVSKGHNNTSSRCGSRRCGWCMCVCVCACVSCGSMCLMHS